MVAAGFSLQELLVGAQHAEPKELRNVGASLAAAHIGHGDAVPLPNIGQGQASPYKKSLLGMLPCLYKQDLLGRACRTPYVKFKKSNHKF